MGFETIIILIIAAIGSVGVALPRADGFDGSGEPESIVIRSDLSEENAADDEVDDELENTESSADQSGDDLAVSSENSEGSAVVEPTIDLMRFDGNTGVVSGQAAPNATVVIRDGQTEIARTTADANGSFAVTFDYESGQTGGILEVGALDADGAFIGADQALTVLPSSNEEDVVTASLSEDGVKVDAPKSATLKLDSLSYGVGSPIDWQGQGQSGATIEILINGKKENEVTVDANGKWVAQTPTLPNGDYVAEFIENGSNSITHSFSVAPFEPAPSVADTSSANASGSDGGVEITENAEGAENAQNSESVETQAVPNPPPTPAPQAVINTQTQTISIGDRIYEVQRGDSLWRIAERYFGDGQGARYTEIFAVNSSQITDPDLIFPDQEIDIPEEQ